ncbi:MAG: hypothetical protein J5809_03980 [Selenomonadaceae bacterium]|nr:hypothetical protein [Selenomonadaceae bacterium]
MKKFFSLLILAALFLFASNVYAASSWRDDTTVSKNFAREVLDLVNVERRKENLRPLKLARDLNHYAQVRAKEITKKFSHTRPNGKSCFTAVARPYRMLGENIAAGQKSSAQVVEEWMNSPSHRENIMNPKFRELGVGYLYQPELKYKHYWTQFFRLR